MSAPSEGRAAGALSPSLDPRGFENYALDKPTSDDNEDLFPSDSEISDSEIIFGGGNLFVVDGRGGMVVCVDVGSINYWWWLRSWQWPGGRFFGGEGRIICLSSFVPCADRRREHERLH